MWHNVIFFSFACMLFWSPSSFTTIDLLIVHLVLPSAASTNAHSLVSVVMIRKTGRATQFWNKRENISQTHLRKHLHLTNCIHLKHHVHMQKTKMKVEVGHPAEFTLIKELSALQKSRSLRDPSTSPAWRSPSVGSLLRKLDREAGKDELARQASVGVDESRTLRRIVSIAANLSADAAARKNASALRDEEGLSEGEGWVEIRPGENRQREAVKASRNSSSTRDGATYSLHHHGSQGRRRESDARLPTHSAPELKGQVNPGKVERNEGSSLHANDTGMGLSQWQATDGRLHLSRKDDIEGHTGYREMASRSAGQVLGGSHGKQRKEASSSRDEGAEMGSIESDRERSPLGSDSTCQSKLWNRDVATSRKRKVQRNRTSQLQLSSIGMSKQREVLYSGLSTTSQDQRSRRSSLLMDGAGAAVSGENDELEISELPQNGCGIPWNWSRIHSRGKNILDMAGRSLSCGASDPGARKSGNTLPRGHPSSSGESIAATASELSDTSFNTDSESLPLLVDPATLLESGSQSEQGLGDQGAQEQRELRGVLSKHRGARCSDGGILSAGEDRHRSLSQKYMPKSFHDIVGQNLVTQSLANALLRGRIAPLYIFYGPRGTGKTSCARVFATALNCLSSEEQRPCGSCKECLANTFGKTSIVKEVSAGGSHGVRGIKALVHDVAWSSSSHYKVYIVDECHALSNQAWNAFLKVVEEAPRNIVFILSTSSLEQLPHAVVSRCQKFLFSKIKESEIINRLQGIAMQEGLDADAEAFKLIASACDGSLRDAEMMLDQLSLLGQKISLSMVQELVGLIPDDKLVDLLDFALSADTVNTVRSLRELMESGVEPLNLMSQLAGLITSILAGGYQLPKERRRRKFFRKKELTKEEMERLRQALKTLSEAEKQLRGSSDRTTWLTAALLQFAPDQSYLLPSSSADTSVTQSPVGMNDASEMLELNSLIQKKAEPQQRYARFSEPGPATVNEGTAARIPDTSKISFLDPRQVPCASSQSPKRSHGFRGPKVMDENGHMQASSSTHFDDRSETYLWQTTLTNSTELEDVWQRVLDAVHSNSLRKFLQTHGKLLSLSLCKGFAVALLEFSQPEHTSRAERSRTSIAHAFQATLGYQVEIKVNLASTTEDQRTRQAVSGDQPSNSSNLWQPTWISGEGKILSDAIVAEGNTRHGQEGMRTRGMHQKSLEVYGTVPTQALVPHNDSQRTNQSFEIVALEGGRTGRLPTKIKSHSIEEKLESAWVQEAPNDSVGGTYRMDKHRDPAGSRSNSTGKSRLSLGFVIQQAEGSVEGYSQDLQFEHMNEGSNRKHMRHRSSEFIFSAAQEGSSVMADKLEEENLRLESKSGGLLCWKKTERGHEKVKQLQQSPRRRGFLLRLVPCAKSNRS